MLKQERTNKNADLDMRENVGFDKVLQTNRGELTNNVSKLSEINECTKKIAKSQKKLKMIILILKNKGSCIQIRRLNTEYDLNTERQTRLKILPQK